MSNSSRILVVDDEPDVLKAWARALKLGGYNVHAEERATKALELSHEHQFDLVILDFIMPEMRGLELLTRIRKHTPFVRSMIVSGKMDSEPSDEALSAELRESVEADLFLRKPVSNDHLLDSVKSLLEGPRLPQDWKSIAAKVVAVRRTTIHGAKVKTKQLITRGRKVK